MQAWEIVCMRMLTLCSCNVCKKIAIRNRKNVKFETQYTIIIYYTSINIARLFNDVLVLYMQINLHYHQ